MQISDEHMEILCGECDANWKTHYEVGPVALEQHVLKEHPQYDPREVPVFVQAWLEESRERYEKAGAQQ